MAKYTPLILNSRIEHDDDEELSPLTADGQLAHQSSSSCNQQRRIPLAWLTIVMAVAAFSIAAMLHVTILSATTHLEPLRSPNDLITTLEMVKPDPYLQKGRMFVKQRILNRPKVRFPMFIVRANAAEPERVYYSGSSVFLSPTNSMFYHWETTTTRQRCYIGAWVSPPEKLAAANKSLVVEGDVTAIEIWNVSIPTYPQTMSWNTRPNRLSLMGTVNFTRNDIRNQIAGLDGQELRAPTPLFDCGGEVNLSVEIVCKSCHLQFDQIFTDPPLAFNLNELA